MRTEEIQPKHDHQKAIKLGNASFMPGESGSAKIKVGKLPTDTTIHISAKVYRSNNPGPTVLVIGGVHGDEINGIQIVRQSILENTFDHLTSGNVIAIPLLNIFGFINFSREVPDGKDINRSFPGYKNGSLASRVAYTLTHEVIPYIDVILDFHTGGNFLYNYPQIRYYPGDPMTEKLAKVFAAKFLIQKKLISNSLREYASQNQIPTLVYEGGESVRLDGFVIEAGLKGMKNVLHHLGIISQDDMVNSHKPLICKDTTWLRAPSSGIFIWSRSAGDLVKEGETLGTIGDPYGDDFLPVKATKDGYIIGHNNASVINQGDALFHIAYGYE